MNQIDELFARHKEPDWRIYLRNSRAYFVSFKFLTRWRYQLVFTFSYILAIFYKPWLTFEVELSELFAELLLLLLYPFSVVTWFNINGLHLLPVFSRSLSLSFSLISVWFSSFFIHRELLLWTSGGRGRGYQLFYFQEIGCIHSPRLALFTLFSSGLIPVPFLNCNWLQGKPAFLKYLRFSNTREFTRGK